MTSLTNRVKTLNEIKYSENNLLIWGIPGFAVSQFIFIYLQKLLEANYGKNGKDVMYETGRQTGFMTTEMLKQRFGHKDMEKLFKIAVEQTELVGYGKLRLVNVDSEKKHFFVNIESNIAKEYARMFGLQKEPVCYFLRGAIAGCVNSITNEELICVETNCMVSGKSTCEFVVKPLKDFGVIKPEIENQMPSNLKKIEIKEKILPQRF